MGLQNGSLDASKLIQNTEVLEKKLEPVVNKLDEMIDRIDQLDGKKAKASVEIDTKDSSKNIDEVKHEFEELLKTIKAPNQKKNYFQSIENSAKDLKKAWRDLVNEAGKGTFTEAEKYDNQYATTVLRCANAFEALKGNIRDISPEISEFIQGMRQMEKYSDERGYNFTVKGFEQAFEVFAKMKKMGATYNGFDFSKGFTEVKQDILELSSLTSIWGQTSFSASEQVFETYEKLGKTAEEVTEKIEKLTEAEMERKLKSEHEKGIVYEWDIDLDDELSDLEKYSKALDNLKQKQKEALSGATMYQNDWVEYGDKYNDEESMNYQIKLYHEYTDRIEYIQKRLQEAIRDYTPSAEGETGKELNALIIILRDLHEEIIKISNAFEKINDSGKEVLSPLLETINKMNISISELSKNVKNIKFDMNMNIDIGSDSEIEAKIQSKISNALQAYQRLFDHIKDTSVGGAVINAKFFEFDINQFDGMMGKLRAYQKFIDNMRKEAKGYYNGKDILYSSTDKKYWTSASSAMGQVTKAFNEMKAASDHNPLTEIFDVASRIDLSDITEQLNGVVQELRIITELVEKGFTVNDILNGKTTDTGREVNGLNAVKQSVEEITKAVDNKTSAFENEAARVAQLIPMETGYLGKLISALKIINEQLEKIGDFSGLDLGKMSIPEIKQGQIATGATNISDNPKEALKRKERIVLKADDTITTEQIAARTLSLIQTTEKLEQDLKNNGSVIKQIIEFYDSQDNLVKTVIKEEKELNDLIQQTTWTTNYNLKDGSSFTSHIDTENYNKGAKFQQKLLSDWDDAIRINEELDIANKYSEDYVYSVQQAIEYETQEKEYIKERNRLLAEGKKQAENYRREQELLKKQEQSSISKRTGISYNKELKLEREINKLKIKNISASEEDVAYNNVLIAKKEELIHKEQEYRISMGLSSSDKESELINKKAILTQELITAQDAYNAKLEETKKKERQEYIEWYSSAMEKKDYADKQKSEKENEVFLKKEQEYSNWWNKALDKKIVQDKIDATKQNNKAAKAYDKLFKSAKKYYELKQKEATSSILDEEIKLLADLDKEWEDAYQSKGRYAGSSNGDFESFEKLNNAKQNFIDNNLSTYQTSIKKFASDTQKALDNIKLNKKNFQYGDGYYKLIDDLQTKITELNGMNLDVVSPKELQEVSDLQNIIKSLLASIKSQTKNLDFQLADPEKVYQQMAKIEQIIHDNTAMSSELRNSFKALSKKYQLVIDTKESQNKLKELNDEFGKLNYQLQASGKTGNSILTLLGKKIKSISTTFVAMYLSFYDLARYIRQGIEVIKEYDTALTEMNKVSNESIQTLKKFQEESFKLADSVGTTAYQLQQSTADWMRLGESLEEAKISAQEANILFNVSEFESIDEATESLVSMSQAFKDLNKREIIDVVNNLGNNFAISTDGLASALQNSASALTTAKNDFFEAAALTTAANTVVQDPDKVGAGLRTIALRLTGTEAAKKELEELGEDISDFEVTTTAKMNESIKMLTKTQTQAGVSLLDMNGNYRSTYDILLDIAKVWEEIAQEDLVSGENRQNALLEMMAGKNRSNILASVLQSPEVLEEAYSYALDSQGSALKENEAYLESIEGKLKQLKNSWDALWINENNREVITFFLDLAKSILEVIKEFGVLNTLLVGGGGIFAAFKAFKISGLFNKEELYNFGEVLKGIESAINQADDWDNCLDDMAKAVKGLNTQEAILALTIKGLNDENQKEILLKAGLITEIEAETYAENKNTIAKGKNLGITKLLSLAYKRLAVATFGSTAALTTFIGAIAVTAAAAIVLDKLIVTEKELNKQIEELNSKWEELTSTIKESAKEFQNLKSQADEIIPKYAELAQGVDKYGKNISLTDEEYEEFVSLNNQLGEMFPELVVGYDSNSNAILSLSGNVDALTDSLYACVEAQRLASAQTIADTMPEVIDNITETEKAYEKKIENIKNDQEELKKLYDLFNSGKYIEEWSSTGESTIDTVELLKKYGINYNSEKTGERDGIVGSSKYKITVDLDEFETSYNSAIAGLDKKADDLGNRIQSKWKQLNPVISSWLSTDYLFQDFDNKGKSIISSMVGEIDFKSLGLTNDEDIKNYITNTVISPIYDMDEEVQEAFFKVFDLQDALNKNELSVREYQDKISMILRGEEYSQEFTALFKLVFDESELQKQKGTNFDSIAGISKSKNTGEYQKAIADIEYLEDYTKDFTKSQWEQWLEVTKYATTATDAVKVYEKSIKTVQENNSLANQLVNSKEALETFTSSVHSAFDAYSTLMNPNVSSADMLSSITQLSELAKTMGKTLNWEMLYGFGDTVTQLGSSIEYISEEYAKSVLAGAGIESDFVDMLAHSIVQAKQAETQLSRLDSQIDSLQSAYTNLNDIIETYNENGFITFDQLQTLLALEPQYLSCLIDENGQLVLNQESMRLLAEQRLNDARAQIIQQAITELSELATHKETTALADNIVTREEQLGKLDEYHNKMAESIAKTAVETELVRELNTELGNASARGASDEDINLVLDNAYKKLKLVDKIGAKTTTNLGGIMGGSGSSSAKDTKETFDWIETLISRIQRNITNLGKIVSATYRNWSTRNNALAQEMAEVNKEINAQMSAYNAYMAEAEKVGLDDYHKKLIQSGAYNIEVSGNEALNEKISLYKEWYEKALNASDAIEDLRANLADLAMTKFDNVAKQYDDQIASITHYVDMLEGYVSQSEAAGYMASEAYYQAMAEKQKVNIEMLQSEYSSLLTAFDEAVKSGSIEKYSEDWYEMYNNINDVEKSLQDATTQLIEFNQTLQQLNWEVFNRVQGYVSNIVTESEALIDILDAYKLHTSKGVITDEGLAVQGLHAVNYNVYMEQALAYAEEMREIEAEMANDPYDMELVDRRNELLGLQQEAISNAMSEKEAIHQLISDGYDKMLESLNELIDKRKEALQAEKDLYDYQNTISEKTSNISSLQKQLQAYAGDNSEGAKATIQKLQVSLAEAEKDLQETEYERYLSDQEQMLDTLYDQTEQWVNERLDNLDGLVAEAIEATNANAETISNAIHEAANAYGYKLSDQMETIWDYEENAIDGVVTIVSVYGDILHGTGEELLNSNTGIANAIAGGTTNVISAINSLNSSMQTIIGKLTEIATANANSIAQAQNTVANSQNNSYPTNNTPAPTTSNTGGSSDTNKQPVTRYKAIVDGKTVGTGYTSEAQAKSAAQAEIERLVQEEIKKALKGKENSRDAGNIANSVRIGYGAQLTRTMKTPSYTHYYKSGTPNAKSGFHYVSDGNGDEIVLTNDGNAVLAKGMQLFPFEGGETVIDASETAELLKGSLVPLSSEQLWSNIIKTPKLPNVGNGIGSNVTNDVQLNIAVKANNYDEFVASFKTAVKSDPQCRKLLQAVTIDETVGRGGLRRNNF